MACQPVASVLTTVMDGVFGSQQRCWNDRKSCLLLSFDCDFPEDVFAIPDVVRQLEGTPVRASFACVGRWVEDYPDEHRVVLESGHELFNHSYSHPELINSSKHFVSSRDDLNDRRWDELTLAEKRQEIEGCQEVVRATLGHRMVGFRTPHFGNTQPEELYVPLGEAGLRYSTSVLAARASNLGYPTRQGEILEIPVTCCPVHPFVSFDSWHSLYARGGWHRADFAEVFERRLTRAIQIRGLTNLYLDPKDAARLQLPRLLDIVQSMSEECWAPTYTEFVEWFCAERQGIESPPGGMVE